MSFTKTMMALAIGSVGVMGSMSAHAVPLGTGATLTITAGAQATTVYGAPTAFATGSWFSIDVGAPIGNVGMGEQVLLSQGTTGLVVGSYSSPGLFEIGTANLEPNNTGTLVDSWGTNGSTGTNYFNSALGGVVPTQGASLGGNLYEFSMSAWDYAWALTSSFNMGTGLIPFRDELREKHFYNCVFDSPDAAEDQRVDVARDRKHFGSG